MSLVNRHIWGRVSKRALVLAVVSGVILVIIATIAGQHRSCENLSRRAIGAGTLKECGQDSLAVSVRKGDAAAVLCHLRLGADARGRVPGDPETTPLLSVASLGGHSSVVSILLEHGARIEDRCIRGRTALMWAAFKGHHEIVDQLLTSLEERNAARRA